jgi:hypothetical protein
MGPLQIHELHDLARRQFSLFSAEQAAALGISRRALDRAADRGILLHCRRGIYGFPGHEPSRWQPLMAAVLAGGPNVVVSHASAAAIHGFYGVLGRDPELTVPYPTRVRLSGVRVHRVRDLDPVDVYTKHGVPITTPIRTAIDIASRLTNVQLVKVIDEGSINRL